MDALAEPGQGAWVRKGTAGFGGGFGATVEGATIGGRVLVLNATYEPIHVCTVRRATILLLKEKAELIERGELAVRSSGFRSSGPW